MQAETILSVERLVKSFAGLKAVDDVSFSVARGEIFGLIGPNGAGKTTTFNLISGRFPPNSGAVRVNGDNLVGLRPDRIVALGLARTFQGARIFPGLSVEENVRIPLLARDKVGFWSDWLGLDNARSADADAWRRADEVLSFTGLQGLRRSPASSLVYAQQSVLGIALALAGAPKLLLLDEPFAGMNPAETRSAAAMVRRIRDGGVTVLLVEHNVAAVMETCDRIAVLDQGRKIGEGSPDEVRRDPRVIEAYLGMDLDA